MNSPLPVAASAQRASALAAALVLAIGMGFGRFAFTGIYPVMVSDGLLTVHGGTLAASANYVGYLLGALLSARARPEQSHRLCLWSMAASVLCLAVLALVQATWLVIAIRGLAGLFSALAMVAASLWLLQHRGHAQGAPLLYAGVGVGIVVSAELLAAGQAFGLHSPALWGVLGLGALILGAIAAPQLKAHPRAESSPVAHAESHTSAPLGAGRLIALYGLAGFGYIITATYLPLFIKGALGPINPIQVWAVFGLGAAPSCFLWHALHLRLGTRRALFLNLIAQAIGVVLPVLSQTAASYLGSAFIVGGTFIGTVTIAMPAARRVAHTLRVSIMAAMTAAYGVGQIAGPLVANALYAGSQSFSLSLLAAGGALGVSAALCLLP